MYRHRTPTAAAALLVLALVLAAGALRGERGRVILATKAAVTVSAPEDAYRVWSEAGVRGRVLLLFDRYPHLDLPYARYLAGARPDARSFLDFAIFGGVVRKIYWVVGDDVLGDLFRKEHLYHPLRRLDGDAMSLLVNDGSGIPFVAARPSSLPPLPEEVLVYVNGALFDAGEVSAVLAERGVAADLTVVLEQAVPR